MIKWCIHFLSVRVYQQIKFCINIVLAHSLIHCLPIELGLLDLLHLAPPVLPLLLQLLYVFNHIPSVTLWGSHGFLLRLHHF